jgi:membrane-associated phospholipid phosphatase
MDSPAVRPQVVGWLSRAGERLRTRWVLKMTGTIAIMAGFFVVYFWLLNHQRLPVTVVPRIFIDRMVAFQPWAVVLYVSLWVYVPLAPAFLESRRELFSYAWATIGMSLVGFAVFIVWPTAVPLPEVAQALHTSVAYLKAVDASGNAFPSLHVAFAVFTAIWFTRILRDLGAGGFVRTLNWLWCLGIVYSTLAIRQHVALDAIAGAVLGAVVGLVHMHAVGTCEGGPGIR